MIDRTDCVFRLRQVDVKAEHFERQVQRLEQERDVWEKKYEVRADTKLTEMIYSDAPYRKHRESISNPRRSWTSLFNRWKDSNWSLFSTVSSPPHVLQSVFNHALSSGHFILVPFLLYQFLL